MNHNCKKHPLKINFKRLWPSKHLGSTKRWSMASTEAKMAWKLLTYSNCCKLRTVGYVFYSPSRATVKKPFSILKLSRTPYIQINQSWKTAICRPYNSLIKSWSLTRGLQKKVKPHLQTAKYAKLSHVDPVWPICTNARNALRICFLQNCFLHRVTCLCAQAIIITT